MSETVKLLDNPTESQEESKDPSEKK
jgi:arginyl-tRNA synthetase